MGVGNWVFRNTEFAQSNYSIDDSDVNYDEQRSTALESVIKHFKDNPVDLQNLLANHSLDGVNDLDDLDLDWFFNNEPEVTETLGLDHLNMSESDFVQQETGDRYDDIQRELATAVAGDLTIASCWKWAETLGSGSNSEFRVAAEGRFVEIGVKQWQTDYFVGVQPKYKVENYEDAINGRSFDTSTGKTEGSDPAMFLKVQQVIAAAALAVEPCNEDFKALALQTEIKAEQDDVFPEDTPSYRRLSGAVADSLMALAEQAETVEEEAYFLSHFGISADDFAGAKPMVELVSAVLDETGYLPQTIIVGYQQEFERANEMVLAALREITPAIYTPTSSWTSARVADPAAELKQEKAQELEAPGL